ncbi:MAG TPA: DUF188 domain-containing protein [Clostridiales bacterium]|nr:DUF188 domain-containing protein [Clostridiales bacterium]HQP69380.1 DUF188 domain-containing protein [Clostridiales bacterium]
MKIFIDGDALPNILKPIIVRSVERLNLTAVTVSNKPVRIGKTENFIYILVGSGADVADDKIAEMVEAGDLVITGDVPLADRVISKNAFAIDHRGKFFDADNIKFFLSVRDLMQGARDSGIQTSGPAPYSQKDAHEFANQFNNILSKHV